MTDQCLFTDVSSNDATQELFVAIYKLQGYNIGTLSDSYIQHLHLPLSPIRAHTYLQFSSEVFVLR